MQGGRFPKDEAPSQRKPEPDGATIVSDDEDDDDDDITKWI